MTRYYFHLRNGIDLLVDGEGRDLASVRAVTESAMSDARSLISAEALDGRIDLDQRIDVETADGTIVHRLEFTDAVAIVRADCGGSPAS